MIVHLLLILCAALIIQEPIKALYSGKPSFANNKKLVTNSDDFGQNGNPASGRVKRSLLKYSLDESLSPSNLCKQNGFKFETYSSTSDDGYITQLFRIVNPDVGKIYLKVPPVILYGGPTVSSSAFIMSSEMKQNSKNDSRLNRRALGFMLSREGYDVWIVPTRGIDDQNLNHIQHSKRYWSFTLDDIVEKEVKNQFELVRNVTGSELISIVPYSIGSFVVLGFLASNPAYTEQHVDSVIALAPVVYSNQLSVYLHFGPRLDTGVSRPIIEQSLDKLTRLTISTLCANTFLKRSICQTLIEMLFGSCRKSELQQVESDYRIIDQVVRPISRRSMEQLKQIAKSGQLRKFDYGLVQNRIRYGNLLPPAYPDLFDGLWPLVDEDRITLIAGECDSFADTASVQRLSEKLKLNSTLVVPGYNHLDIIAGYNVDTDVNSVILERLNLRHADLTEVGDMERSWMGQESSRRRRDASYSTSGYISSTAKSFSAAKVASI